MSCGRKECGSGCVTTSNLPGEASTIEADLVDGQYEEERTEQPEPGVTIRRYTLIEQQGNESP